jgi:hypothetical protein
MSLKLFFSVENKIYQNFFVFILFFLPSSLTFSQVSESEMLIYEYNRTTENAIKELYEILGDDKIKLSNVLIYIEDLAKDKIFVLSTYEYLPIKNRIENFHNSKSLSKDEYQKEKEFEDKINNSYRVITDIIN